MVLGLPIQDNKLALPVADPLVGSIGLQPGIEKKKSNMLVNLQIGHQQLITRVPFKVKNTLPNSLFQFLSLSPTTILKPRIKKDPWSPSRFLIFMVFEFGWLYTFLYWYALIAFRTYINFLLAL